MFLLYINDLQCAFSKPIIHNFTNNANLICSTKKLGTTESVINNELKHRVQWLRGNKLSLTETKTELIIFRSSSKQLPQEYDIRLNNCKLKLHTHVKYLVIFIDKVLSWNKQIDILCSKLSRAKLRHLALLKACLLVHYSIFYSHLLHCYLAWSYKKKSIWLGLIKYRNIVFES